MTGYPETSAAGRGSAEGADERKDGSLPVSALEENPLPAGSTPARRINQRRRTQMVNLYRMRQLLRQTVKVQWRIEQEEARATKITTTLTGMPRGGAQHDQVQDGAIRIVELRDAYREIVDEIAEAQAVLNPLINALENADDRAVMRLRYIKGFSPEDIAEAIHRTDRSVYYYLSRAEDQLVRKFPDVVSK